MPQIITRCVGTVFGKFLAEAEIGGPMQTGHEPINHGRGHQIQPGNGIQHGGVQQVLHGISLAARNLGQHLAQDLICLDTVGLGMEIQQNAMPQYR